jgi:asparagine synthase (glutamine-hydrolysing)
LCHRSARNEAYWQHRTALAGGRDYSPGMCGIAGLATKSPDPARTAQAFAATRALHHRGPDGTRLLTVAAGAANVVDLEAETRPAEIVAGSSRLSIIDLEGGDQPIANERSTVWVTYNGEIYNHLELRRELEERGHRFRTHADTEVLVHGWEEWAVDLFPRLNGIFAFAIIDLTKRAVVLGRDPLGVKPLYVGTSEDTTWWSSELDAAIDAGLADGPLSSEAIQLFLTFRFVPSPYAIRERAWKLPPGSFVRLELGEAGRPPWFESYEPRIRSELEPRSRREWRDALGAELEAAVTRQLMSDVPLASLLSGGVDSTLTTHFMRAHLAAAPESFAIGFSSDGAENETLQAAAAADELDVPLHVRVLEDRDYAREWSALVPRFGEPTANTSSAMLHAICVDVGRTHKVALCGQGADELLGGYPRHVAERVYRFGRRAPAVAGFAASRFFGGDGAERVRRLLAADDRLDRYVEIFAHLPPAEVDALVPGGSTRELARSIIARWASPEAPDDTLNELLRVDARMSLADDLLMVADLCSMYESVELRVPFLDLAFVELVERMPSRYKIGALGTRKRLYGEAAAARLPAASRRRLEPSLRPWRRKRGFSPPRGNPFIAATADDPGRPLGESGLFTDAAVSRALARGGRRRDVLLALASWLSVHEPSRAAA